MLYSSQDLIEKPIEIGETLPSALYTRPESQEVERLAIFRRQWQLVGHLSRLEASGGSITLEIAGNPIIVVKDGESVRGFYNVCRHRGGPLCIKKGTRSMLMCEYHGWTYTMQGMLRGVPQFDRVELFDKKDFGLTPVRTEVWNSLIFVTLDGQARPVADVLEGISQRISPIRIEEMRFHSRVSYDIACNWKVYVDNFLEGYHIPIVHPELAKLLDYSQYVTELHEHYSLQYSPFSSSSSDNPYHAEDGKAYYYFVYPNFMLNILPGRMQLNIVEPLGVDRCRVHFDYHYTDPDHAASSGLIADDLAYSETIQQEDIDICQAVQKGLFSDAYDKGRFSVKREQGVWHFQNLVRRSLKALNGSQGI